MFHSTRLTLIILAKLAACFALLLGQTTFFGLQLKSDLTLLLASCTIVTVIASLDINSSLLYHFKSACQQELDQVLEEISKMTSEDNRGPLENLYGLKFPNCDRHGFYNLKQVSHGCS